MILVIVLLELRGLRQLRLHIYDPLHDLLIFSVNALGLTLLRNVVERLGRTSLHAHILRIALTFFTLCYMQ